MLGASRVNSNTPFGTTEWTRPDGPGGPWTLNQRLDPAQQKLYEQDLQIRQGQGDIAQNMMGRVANEYSSTPNFASLLPEYQQQRLDTTPLDRNKMEDAYYNRMMRFAEPRLQQEEQRQHERLTSQGFNLKDPAYNDAMSSLREGQNMQRADAVDRAIIGGGTEATQQLGRNIAAGQFGQSEQMRQLAQALQSINVRQQDRGRSLNELNAFRTGQQVQVPGLSGTAPTPNLQNVDQLGLAGQQYRDQLGGWNAQQAQQGNFLSGLMGLGGTLGSAFLLGGLSDARLKRNIRHIGQTSKGHKLYSYEYVWGEPGVGVLAHEVPHAAIRLSNGYYAVDYSKVL